MASVFSARLRRVAVVDEVTYGTTPATPSFQEMRVGSGSNFKTEKKTVSIEELHPDSNVRDEIMVGQDVSGYLPFQLSYGGVFDTFLAAALRGTWATNVLSNGVLRQPKTFEETLTGVDGVSTYHRFSGCEIDQFSLDATANKDITGSMTIVGQKETTGGAIIAGATYAAPSTTNVMSSLSAANLSVASLAPTPRIKRVSFQIANEFEPIQEVGNLYRTDQIPGLAQITGEIDALFTDLALYNLFLSHGAGSLAFTIGSVTLEKYTISFPAIRFQSAEKTAGGQTGAVMVNIKFRAVGDAASPSITITRAVA
jgi:hypothetical protein